MVGAQQVMGTNAMQGLTNGNKLIIKVKQKAVVNNNNLSNKLIMSN